MQKFKQDNEFGIGKNLKRLREKKGYTQVEVSAYFDLYGINISRVTYNKMEHNYYSIRIKELMILKQIYGCDYEAFFEDIPIPQKKE